MAGRDVRPYWAGLPSIGRRALSDDERRELGDRARRLRTTGCELGCLVPFLFVCAILAMTEAGDASNPWLAAAIPLIVILACAVLWAHTLLSRAAALRRDARAGYVEAYPLSQPPRRGANAARAVGEAPKLPRGFTPLFADLPPPAARPESSLDAEVGPASTPLSPECTACIEVLPESRVAWRVDGRPATRWTEYPRVEAAAAPEGEPEAGWLRSAPDGREVNAAGRALSTAEIRELRHRRHWLVRTPLPFVLLFNLWALSPVPFALSSGEWPPVDEGWMGLIALAVLCDLVALSNWRLAWLLSSDIRLGRVTVIRRPPVAWPLPAGVQPVLGEAVVEEYLPISRRLWSRRGRPAEWRTTKAEE